MQARNGEKRVMGIDLAGSDRRNTGICIIDEDLVKIACTRRTDDEILELFGEHAPALIAIDAPLSLPEGRTHIDEKNDKHFRECDLMLRKLGIKFFPITLGPMRMLTKRGFKLKNELEKRGAIAVEAYPGANYDVWGVKRKDKGEITAKFSELGFKLDEQDYSQDELDAVCCAITGNLILSGKAKALKGRDGCIWIPGF